MALFPEEILETDPRQKMKEEDTWINYFLAGYKSIIGKGFVFNFKLKFLLNFMKIKNSLK